MRKPVYERIRTRRDRERQLLILVVLVGIIQFGVDIAADYLGREWRTFVRVVAAGAAAYWLSLVETLKAREPKS